MMTSGKWGRIARYARGADYHDVLRERLNLLLAWLQAERPGCAGRGVVDTAPLLERDFARRAGLGWFGKNTMLLNKRLGSYFFLAALLVDVELRPDEPFPPQPLRHLHRLPRRLPHGGVRRPRRPRLAPLHQLPHHRIEGRRAGGAAARRRRLAVRMRHLPGGLSVEPQGAGCDGAGVPAAAGPGIGGCDRAAGTERGGIPPAFPGHGPDAEQAARPAAQRGAGAGQRRRRAGAAGPAARTGDAEPLVREAAEWAIAEIQRRL